MIAAGITEVDSPPYALLLNWTTYLRRDVLLTAEHNLVLKMVRIGHRHTQEDVPVLDRHSPLLRLEDLPELSLWPT